MSIDQRHPTDEAARRDLEVRVAQRTAELIRANERLRESEARYRSVVESQSEFVVRWLPGAIFTFVNEAFCRLLGKTETELLDWCFLPIVHPDDAPAFGEAIAKLNRENSFADFENRILLPDGSYCWTQWTNQMLFDENGQFLEYQSVGRDVTELKNAADTIREKEAHLAYMSRLATMGELVAGMAHEVHQPLHAAKTFAEAARRNLEMDLPNKIETALDCTKEISNAISRTAKIIRQLREFTHTRAVEYQDLDLSSVIREATELIAFETRKAQVKLTFDLAPELPEVQGDRIQLQQAFVILLMNAYEAMADIPVQHREVHIRTQHESHLLCATFRDTGCGVAIEDMEKLFSAFYSTKRQGMGMGLSLGKSIVEAHGGRVWGERNDEAGMTFVVELPTLQRRSERGS